MYAVNDDASYALAMREALAVGTLSMCLTLAHTLASDPRMPDDMDVINLDDHIAVLEFAREQRLCAIAEYREKTGETAERTHNRSLERPS